MLPQNRGLCDGKTRHISPKKSATMSPLLARFSGTLVLAAVVLNGNFGTVAFVDGVLVGSSRHARWGLPP